MWFPSRFLNSNVELRQVRPAGTCKRLPSAPGNPTLWKIIGAVFLAAALPGCSAIRIAYNQAPELAYWYLDDYVGFTGAQSLQLKADLAGLQAWHRQSQLPVYVEFLQSAQQQAGADVTPTQACKLFNEARRKFLVLAERAEPVVATLAVTLDPVQLKTMEKRFAKGNAEFREEFMEDRPQAIRKRRVESAVKRAETLYGRIDDRQTELLERIVDRSAFDASRSYAERVRRQQDTLQTLQRIAAGSAGVQGNASAAAAATSPADPSRSTLKALTERLLTSPDAAYRTYAERLTEDACRHFAEFHNTTSPAQRSKAAQVLGGYEKDLRTLSAPGAG